MRVIFGLYWGCISGILVLILGLYWGYMFKYNVQLKCAEPLSPLILLTETGRVQGVRYVR